MAGEGLSARLGNSDRVTFAAAGRKMEDGKWKRRAETRRWNQRQCWISDGRFSFKWNVLSRRCVIPRSWRHGPEQIVIGESGQVSELWYSIAP